MIRSLAAIIAGHLSISVLNGFSRLVIALYSRSEIHLSGVGHLPSPYWGYFIVGLGLIFGIFGGLITCSIAKRNYGIEVLALSSLIIITGLFDYQFLNTAEPIWYLSMNPLAKIAGVWIGYGLKRSQDQKLYAGAQ